MKRILAVVADRQTAGPAYTEIVTEWAAVGGRLVKASADLNRRCSERAATSSQESAGRLSRAVMWMAGGCGLALLLGIVSGWLLKRGIEGVLKPIANEMNQVSEQMTSASGQVAASSQSLARGSSEQAASLEETSASSEAAARLGGA